MLEPWWRWRGTPDGADLGEGWVDGRDKACWSMRSLQPRCEGARCGSKASGSSTNSGGAAAAGAVWAPGLALYTAGGEAERGRVSCQEEARVIRRARAGMGVERVAETG